MDKEHLGDSVYAQIERGIIVLTTESDSGYVTSTIYLQEATRDHLLRYIGSYVMEKMNARESV